MMLMNYVRPSLPIAFDLRVGHIFDEVFRAIEGLRWMRQLCWTCLFLLSVGLVTATAMAEELRGNLVVVGRGPERPMIEQLARAFEKAHLGTAVDIKWSHNFRIADMVTSGEADLAVADREEAGLAATTIAWDGLAVIVNFSNPIKEVTRQQVAALFSGRILNWSELNESAKGNVRVVLRPDDQNLTAGFEHSLGIVSVVSKNAEHIRSDQQVLSHVSGRLDAIGYLSLKAALEAVSYGVPVRILLIDEVEPGKPAVQSGQYTLKRPIIFLAHKEPTFVTRAFISFALSPAGQHILDEMYIPLAHEPSSPAAPLNR